MIAIQPGVGLMIFQSWVQRPKHYATKPSTHFLYLQIIEQDSTLSFLKCLTGWLLMMLHY